MTAKKLTKKDIVQQLSCKVNILRKEIAPLVQGVLDTISDALAHGTPVELRNFGVFEIQVRKERIGRNPNQPDKCIRIPRQSVIKFRPGRDLREKVKVSEGK